MLNTRVRCATPSASCRAQTLQVKKRITLKPLPSSPISLSVSQVIELNKIKISVIITRKVSFSRKLYTQSKLVP